MTDYRVRVEQGAEKQIRRLPGHVRQRIRRTIGSLAHDPLPPAANELRAHPGYFRIHLDRWRIIYLVEVQDGLITVIAIQRKTGPETYSQVLE